jgi:hypothetical protein
MKSTVVNFAEEVIRNFIYHFALKQPTLQKLRAILWTAVR